jgi:hypothetical protein
VIGLSERLSRLELLCLILAVGSLMLLAWFA